MRKQCFRVNLKQGLKVLSGIISLIVHKLPIFSKTLDEKRGFVPKTGKIISTNKDIGTGTTQKQTLLVADNTIMEMFIRNDKTEREYADAINRYAEKLPENIKLFSMVIPTQLEFKEPIYKNCRTVKRIR